ncbi:hypothetical protein KXV85_002474, partial [Aspergillus fumigatus]
TKKRPVYHVVVAASRYPRDGRFIARLGYFNPLLPKANEARLKLDLDKVKSWMSKGAQPSDRVMRFLDAAGVAKRTARQNPEKARRSAVAGPVCVARIGAAHGVRGAVKLWTFTEDPLAVQSYGPLTTKDGARQFEIASVREAKDHLVATFKGVATRNDAERLNGIELYVPREKLPAVDDGEYYHTDLIGLAA